MAETGIIYLHKDKFDFYSPQVTRVIEFRFIPEIVKDLDVISPELLENLIKLFIANNKILPCGLIIILTDDASFIKDFLMSNAPPQLPQGNLTRENTIVATPRMTPEVIEEQIKSFVENVPFDDVASETYPMTTGTKAWATNKELYGSIASSFEKQGFEIKAVLPGLVFEGDISSKPILDTQTVAAIMQKFEMVKKHSLLIKKAPEVKHIENTGGKIIDKTEEVEENIEIDDKPVGAKSKKRLYAMIGIFVVLIIILIFVYIGSLQQP